MKDQDYELLSQYLDGELPGFAERRLEQRLRAEPELATTLEQLRQQDSRIQAALADTARAPARVHAMLEPESNVVALPRRRARAAWQYAVAASLVAAAGLVINSGWQQSPNAEHMLADVLESTPSMAAGWEALADGRKVRPVLSFKDQDGNWCREFLVSQGEDGSRGVACRQQGAWNTQVLVTAEIPGEASDFRPAGAGDADAVADYLGENAAGIALSASEEAELIENDRN